MMSPTQLIVLLTAAKFLAVIGDCMSFPGTTLPELFRP